MAWGNHSGQGIRALGSVGPQTTDAALAEGPQQDRPNVRQRRENLRPRHRVVFRLSCRLFESPLENDQLRFAATYQFGSRDDELHLLALLFGSDHSDREGQPWSSDLRAALARAATKRRTADQAVAGIRRDGDRFVPGSAMCQARTRASNSLRYRAVL